MRCFKLPITAALLSCLIAMPACTRMGAQAATTETLVIFRHGEKPAGGLGQLNCRGLNRAIALPAVLDAKFGRPDYLFAPDPAVKVRDGLLEEYSYVRPLATLEPTAIRLGMPVNTQIGYSQIDQLERELLQPKYASAKIFIAWEHWYEERFTKHLLSHLGASDSAVPGWPGSEYDMIYVVKITRSGNKTTASFTLDHEGLNDKLSDSCPVR